MTGCLRLAIAGAISASMGICARESFLHRRIRQLIYGRYRVLFKVKEKTVYVLRIRHGSARDLKIRKRLRIF